MYDCCACCARALAIPFHVLSMARARIDTPIDDTVPSRCIAPRISAIRHCRRQTVIRVPHALIGHHQADLVKLAACRIRDHLKVSSSRVVRAVLPCATPVGDFDSASELVREICAHICAADCPPACRSAGRSHGDGLCWGRRFPQVPLLLRGAHRCAGTAQRQRQRGGRRRDLAGLRGRQVRLLREGAAPADTHGAGDCLPSWLLHEEFRLPHPHVTLQRDGPGGPLTGHASLVPGAQGPGPRSGRCEGEADRPDPAAC